MKFIYSATAGGIVIQLGDMMCMYGCTEVAERCQVYAINFY